MPYAMLWMTLAGCGDKEPTSTAAPVKAAEKAEAAPKAKSHGGIEAAPADEASQKFATSLTALDITDFKPSSMTGGQIAYTHLKFRPEGVWAATGFVEAGDEKIDCSETGTWSMDPASSETMATMTWKIEKTDCAGRDAGGETRAEVTITPDGKIETNFR
jgi:hypothetical protein